MRYAVTGATGFLGTVLADQLRDAGHEVAALVRDPSKASHLRDIGAETVTGDLDDAAALDRLLAGADGFFHLAGWYRHGRREAEALRRANIDGTRNAFEAALRVRVPKVVYTSTLAVNSDTHGVVVDESYTFTGRHLSEYDRTKAVAHDIALEYIAAGLPLVIVQSSAIYGPGNDGSTMGEMIRRVAQGRRVIGPRAGGAAFTHVADTARGHVLAMERGRIGQSYILAGPTATYDEVLNLVATLAGTRPPILIPSRLLLLAALFTSPVERLVPVPQSLTAEAALSGVATYYGSAAKAERELEWSARPLAEGFSEMVESIRRS